MGDELYLEPNRRAQIVVLLTIVLAALLFASLDPLIKYITPSQSAASDEIKAGATLLLLLNICVNAIAIALSLIWIIYWCRIGYRSLRSGSYPPPGTIVIIRTRVRTGKQALINGWSAILFAAVMLLLCALLFYKEWLLTKLLLATNAF